MKWFGSALVGLCIAAAVCAAFVAWFYFTYCGSGHHGLC